MSTPVPDSTSASERTSEAFSRLTQSAKNINNISDRLSKQIGALEQCLSKINVGVACWTTINEGRDQYEYWSQRVGYTRIRGKWCIAIETREGEEWSDRDRVE